MALVAGGLAGGELYARNRADSILSEVTQCVVQDGATISFGVNPPFLWQHITGHYTNISVSTAGDRVQSANGMTADVTLEDVRLQETADSKGTIGSLNATLTWKSAGIKDTVAANLPGVGSLITGVRTDPAAGTIVLEAGDNSVTAKPVVTDGDLNLEVTDVSGPLPKDAVQIRAQRTHEETERQLSARHPRRQCRGDRRRGRREVLQSERVDPQGGRQPLLRAALARSACAGDHGVNPVVLHRQCMHRRRVRLVEPGEDVARLGFDGDGDAEFGQQAGGVVPLNGMRHGVCEIVEDRVGAAH